MAKLGIQTIIFGKRGGHDLAGVLRDIKAAGYDGAEIGLRTDLTANEIVQLFGDHGLLCCGYHTGFGTFTNPDELQRTAEQLQEVGGRYLMCSGTAGRDREGYLRSAEVFNAAAQTLQPMGVTLCYHNHNWEFFPLNDAEGGNGMDLLIAHTDPFVKLCLDVYWVACGGEDPAPFIEKHADRIAYFHFKDGTFDPQAQQPKTFTELGRGQVDLRAATKAALALNPEWIVTEQDSTDGDPATSAKISADYARGTLGI